MSIMVYWIERLPNGDMFPACELFPDGEDQITTMLNTCEALRKAGKEFVTSCSHHSNGVSGIVDGKLPDGTAYQWRKRRPY